MVATREPADNGRERAAVVVPVKAFDLAKGRLSTALTAERRRELAMRMAAGVVAAADPLPAFVVCDDDDVADWAIEQGAGVLWREVSGLNPAVTAARDALADLGFDRAIIAHGDLPLARRIAWVGSAGEVGGVVIVRDRRRDGTNVLSVPTGAGFVFRYGPGSADDHRAEAERLGLAVAVVDDEELGWDVDTPEDLAVFDRDDP